MTSVEIRIRAPRSSVGDGVKSSGRARFSTRLYFPARLMVTVEGEVDASNRRDLGRFVERHLHPTAQLLLDLRSVNFFGAQGFSALHYVSVCCNRSDVDWVIVGGRAVRHLLTIVDPDHVLPLADDFDSACEHLDHLVCRRYPIPGAVSAIGYPIDRAPRSRLKPARQPAAVGSAVATSSRNDRWPSPPIWASAPSVKPASQWARTTPAIGSISVPLEIESTASSRMN
jgi:anti-anti-sigma factor